MSAFYRPTLQQLIQRNIADINAALPESDANQLGSNLNVLATVHAGAMHGAYGALEALADNIMYDTCDQDHVLRGADFYGISRKNASKATGAITITGTAGSTLTAGTQFQQGGFKYQTQQDVTIDTSLTAHVDVIASAAGIGSNSETGMLSLVSPVPGIAPSAEITTPIIGGSDIETIGDLRRRLLHRLRQPPRGGAPHDYEYWSMEVDGITRAWCYRAEPEAGHVTVRVVNDHADDLQVTEGVIQTALDYIHSVRPAGQSDLHIVRPQLKTVPFSITLKTVGGDVIKQEIMANLTDYFNELRPGQTALISKIREAISTAEGEYDHLLTTPSDDITCETDELAMPGTISWSGV